MIGAVLSWLLFPEPYIICTNVVMKNLVLIISLTAATLEYILNLIDTTYKLKSLMDYKFVVIFGSVWFIPFLRTKKISEIYLVDGMMMEKLMDKGWYEYFGDQGLYYIFRKLFIVFNILQINRIKVFIKIFVVGVVIMLFTFINL